MHSMPLICACAVKVSTTWRLPPLLVPLTRLCLPYFRTLTDLVETLTVVIIVVYILNALSLIARHHSFVNLSLWKRSIPKILEPGIIQSILGMNKGTRVNEEGSGLLLGVVRQEKVYAGNR